MLNTLGIANKVKLHLIYSVLWSNITTVVVDQKMETSTNEKNMGEPDSVSVKPSPRTYILKGENPKSGQIEYVLAISKRRKITLENLDLVFMGIEEADHKELGSVDKILMAIVDSDGSILFYYVHRGVKSVSS